MLILIMLFSPSQTQKLYVPVVTLSTKGNKKLSNFLKDLEDQFIGMNIKQKV